MDLPGTKPHIISFPLLSSHYISTRSSTAIVKYVNADFVSMLTCFPAEFLLIYIIVFSMEDICNINGEHVFSQQHNVS